MSPMISSVLVVCCLGGQLAETKELPAPIGQDGYTAYFDELRQEIGRAPRSDRRATADEILDRMVKERAAAYEGAVLKVSSEPREASMGTSLNFREERKPIRFSIESPKELGVLTVRDFPDQPKVEVKRGSERRVVDRRTDRRSPDSTKVDFSFTLVEPDLSENDVHVVYSGWVDYEYTGKGALAAAKSDLAPVFEFAEEELESRASIDEEEARKSAEAAARQAAKAREDELKAVQVSEPPNDPYSDKIVNIVTPFVAGVVCPLVVQLINGFFRRRRGMGHHTPEPRNEDQDARVRPNETKSEKVEKKQAPTRNSEEKSLEGEHP